MKTCFLVLCFPLVLSAQDVRPNALRVFLDCSWRCDQSFLKAELHYIDFMRDRADAEVFVRQTWLNTGGGGVQLTLLFQGQKKFAGLHDTLTYHLPPAASREQERDLFRKYLEQGLLPYLLKTNLASRISFQLEPEPAGSPGQPPRDPWNFWTIAVEGNVEAQGQESARSLWLQGGVEARRVTEKQKSAIGLEAELNRSRFHFEGDVEEVYQQNGFRLEAMQVQALGQHWSAGLFGRLEQSQYNNREFSVLATPGLEYNLFPYREAATRQLAFRYRAGAVFNRYFQETIYFKTREVLWSQSLSAAYKQVMPWGSFNLGLNGTHYLHDWTLHALHCTGGIELNLFKGFRINFYGNFGLLHNQVELANGGASPQEVYLRVRQLKTDFNYYLWCGVSYTLGSIYSNVVNPRFEDNF